MTYVVTDTAAPGVHLISDRESREVLATVKGKRELAEKMCVVLNGKPTSEMLEAGRRQCMTDMLGPHMGPNVENIWLAMVGTSTQ